MSLLDSTLLHLPLAIYIVASLSALRCAYLWYRRCTALDFMHGPEAPSFITGHEKAFLYQDEVGDLDFEWIKKYGAAWRSKGCLGEDQLMVADPKAMQYVLHTSAYKFRKTMQTQQLTRMMIGKGMPWAHGEMHQRQRRIMNPSFAPAQLKTFTSLFQRKTMKLVQNWTRDLAAAETGEATKFEGDLKKGREPVLNIAKGLSKLALDIIGSAGFGYEFGTLDDSNDEMAHVYDNLFVDTMLHPTTVDLIFKSLWRHVPEEILHYVRYLPTSEYKRFRHFLDYIQDFARGLIRQSEIKGDGKDMMSVLIRANNTEEGKGKMTEGEVVDQVSAILLAGHEATANSITWIMWELAKDPAYQSRIRVEVLKGRVAANKRGDEDLSMADLDEMVSMQNAIKESFRLHPIVWHLFRVAPQDDLIPLAYPIVNKNGEEMFFIPVKKGQYIRMSFCAYHRLPQVWGEDAQKWNPDRFANISEGKLNADGKQQVPVGLYSNLMNFSGGVRGCIGWRFSIIQIQALVALLLEHFEFSLPPGYGTDSSNTIKRLSSPVMVPAMDGKYGAWMGLNVRPLKTQS